MRLIRIWAQWAQLSCNWLLRSLHDLGTVIAVFCQCRVDQLKYLIYYILQYMFRPTMALANMQVWSNLVRHSPVLQLFLSTSYDATTHVALTAHMKQACHSLMLMLLYSWFTVVFYRHERCYCCYYCAAFNAYCVPKLGGLLSLRPCMFACILQLQLGHISLKAWRLASSARQRAVSK